MNITINIYTDGSSRGNPGPGGFGVVAFIHDNEDFPDYSYSESTENTTNNREELKAILHAFEYAMRLQNHPFYKKHHKEETKMKISNANKGNIPWNKGLKDIYSEESKGFKKVICLNNLEVFKSLKSAGICAGLKGHASISNCCRGKSKTAGKINGEPARWMYYEDYIKLNSK